MFIVRGVLYHQYGDCDGRLYEYGETASKAEGNILDCFYFCIVGQVNLSNSQLKFLNHLPHFRPQTKVPAWDLSVPAFLILPITYISHLHNP